MSSTPVDTTMSKPQTSVVPSATTSASAQRAPPEVPQLTATHQSRDSKQTDCPSETRPATRQQRRAHARDDNFGRAGEGTSMGGRQALADRRSTQEQSENYKGASNGKKPDAMLASLLYRVHQELQPWSASWRTAHTWKRIRRQLHFRPCKWWRREQTNREQFVPRSALSSCPRRTKQRNGQWRPRAEHGAASVHPD